MRGHLERILGLLSKEFRQLLRDPRMARIVFVAPLIQLIIFGYAVSTDLHSAATFLVDHDNTRESRELVGALTASGYFRIQERSQRSADLVRALDRGDAVLGLEIPPGFSRDLARGDADVQILLDGTNSNTASVAQSYAQRIVTEFGREHGPAAARAPDPVDLRARAWYNADLASRDYNVPAVVGGLILLVSLLLTSLAVVREREIGTLEQLRVSPMSATELIAGKTIPFALIGLVDLTVVTTAAILWFGVPFRGAFWVLLSGSVLYILAGLGLGLLISTISKTQQEAFMASFLFFMPAILLSGFLFPVSSMPAASRWLTLLDPMRHYIEIVRAVFLKGVGYRYLWRQHLYLAGLAVGLLGAATARFRRELG